MPRRLPHRRPPAILPDVRVERVAVCLWERGGQPPWAEAALQRRSYTRISRPKHGVVSVDGLERSEELECRLW